MSCARNNRWFVDPHGWLSSGVSGVNRRRLRFGLLFALFIVAWGLASWFLAERLTFGRMSRLIEREREVASSGAASIAANVELSLAHMRSIPKVLARQPDIETALSRIGPDVQKSSLPQSRFRENLENDPDLGRVAKRLEAIIAEVDIDQIWIVNAAADCIASGGFPAESTATGVNYADREYFRMAKKEGFGRQFAVGRTTNTPGIYYSAALVAENRFLGGVVVKVDATRLARLVADKNTFITDENGVVIVAGDARLYMKAVPGARVDQLSATEKMERYKRHQFDTLKMTPVDVSDRRMVRLEDRDLPMLLAFSDTRTDILSVWVFRDVPELWGIRDDGLWIFVLLFLTGTSVMASIIARVIHLRRNSEHQDEIARVNHQLVALNDELQVQARFDALTGCANRRHFLEELDLELKRAGRFDFSCSLAMLDIDHFKAVNDHYGHAAGDTLLRHFSRTVHTRLRSSDLLGRLGGEEFALLMPQTPLAGALVLAERIREVVENSSALSEGIEIRCTVSIGVVEWRGNEDTVETFIARSDAAMYAAKHAGRNRIHAEPVRETQNTDQ